MIMFMVNKFKTYENLAQMVMKRADYYRSLDDSQLKAQTKIFRRRLSMGSELDELLVDAFAVVREADRRV